MDAVSRDKKRKIDCPLQSAVVSSSAGWTTCYSEDIYQHCLNLEKDRMTVYPLRSILPCRPVLLKLVSAMVKRYGMSNLTHHLVVYIMDNFLSPKKLQLRNKLKLATVAAFLLAAKVEELFENIPQFQQLNNFALAKAFSLQDYRDIEVNILLHFDFNVTVPTTATFANLFMEISVIEEDFITYKSSHMENDPPTPNPPSIEQSCTEMERFANLDELRIAINKLLLRMADFTLESNELINAVPSQKAAACLLASRSVYDIYPVWTKFLETHTKQTEADLRPIVKIILSLYKIHEANVVSSTTDELFNLIN